METSLDTQWIERIKETFHLKGIATAQYSPLTLAYIGDGFYELIIRTIMIEKGNAPVNTLHSKTSHIVKAASQAAIIQNLEDALTEEEMHVFKRGRNAKSATTAKNSSVTDYRIATGFEALMGYLYLEHQEERAIELVHLGLTRTFPDLFT